MTRERIAGFLLGISVGAIIGLYLLPAERNRDDLVPGFDEERDEAGHAVPPALFSP